jgi:hypothetical protein
MHAWSDGRFMIVDRRELFRFWRDIIIITHARVAVFRILPTWNCSACDDAASEGKVQGGIEFLYGVVIGRSLSQGPSPQLAFSGVL